MTAPAYWDVESIRHALRRFDDDVTVDAVEIDHEHRRLGLTLRVSGQAEPLHLTIDWN